jgi:hypothetical protein
MPNRLKATFQTRIGLNARRDFRETRLHTAPDEPENRRQGDQVADIVSKVHRPPPEPGLTRGVNDHRERVIEIDPRAPLLREEVVRGQ